MSELENIRKKMMEKIEDQMNESQKMSDMPSKPLQASDATIDSILSTYENVVVDMWAPWCGPCRMLSPIIEKLANDMHGKVVFAKINTDENPVTSSRYRIMSIPSILMFKKGKLIDSTVGALPEDMLCDWITRQL